MARRNPLGEIGADTDRGAAIFARPRVTTPPYQEEKTSEGGAAVIEDVTPAAPQTPPMPVTEVSTPKRQDVKASKLIKRPMTIRLTEDAKDRLSEIERSLQRGGLSAHQASASEIFMALLESADIAALRERLTPSARRRS
jgi:hypothetical protein